MWNKALAADSDYCGTSSSFGGDTFEVTYLVSVVTWVFKMNVFSLRWSAHCESIVNHVGSVPYSSDRSIPLSSSNLDDDGSTSQLSPVVGDNEVSGLVSPVM